MLYVYIISLSLALTNTCTQDSIFGDSPTHLRTDDDIISDRMPSPPPPPPPPAHPKLANAVLQTIPSETLSSSMEEPEILPAQSPVKLPSAQHSLMKNPLQEATQPRRKEVGKTEKRSKGGKGSLKGTPATSSLSSTASGAGEGVKAGKPAALSLSGSSTASKGQGVFYASSHGSKTQEGEGGGEGEPGMYAVESKGIV